MKMNKAALVLEKWVSKLKTVTARKTHGESTDRWSKDDQGVRWLYSAGVQRNSQPDIMGGSKFMFYECIKLFTKCIQNVITWKSIFQNDGPVHGRFLGHVRWTLTTEYNQ